MSRVAIIGSFCNGINVADGQSIKTRIVAQEIETAFGKDELLRIDTYNWRKAPFKLFVKSFLAVRKCSNVIFMTDINGIRIFPRLLCWSNVFNKCKLHYVVVGGWLASFLKDHQSQAKYLKRLSGIFVETRAMKDGLEEMNFANVHLMPNCKTLVRVEEDSLDFEIKEPYRLCTFSRVMREKGIEDAAEAVRSVNEYFGKIVCTLDIFGQVAPKQTDWFDAFSKRMPSEIRYCGVVSFDKSVETLKDYHVLLFPTRFYTEGIPGTIIDAYAAGVPVIASEWEGFSDIIVQGVTGFSYPFSKPKSLADCLKRLILSPDLLIEMKRNCLKKAEDYSPQNVIGVLLDNLA